MCSQQETEEVLAMLEDSDDDDDDIWTAGGLAPPSHHKKKPAAAATSKENMQSPPPAAKAKRERSESELQAKALADAESTLSSRKICQYADVQSLDQVRWHLEKVKGSSSKTKSSSKPHPCYIVTDYEGATSGLDEAEKKALKYDPQGRNDTLIRFICTSNFQLRAVPKQQLRSYFAVTAADGDDGAGEPQRLAKAEEDDGGSAPLFENSTSPRVPPQPKWDPVLLQQYLDSIKGQKKFADPDGGAVNLRAERLFLELFLQFVGEKQRNEELRALQQEQTEMEQEEDDDPDDKHDEQLFAPSENSNPVTQDSADDGDEGDASAAADDEKVPADRGEVQRPDKLHAGDQIEYCPVESRFCKEAKKLARVTKIDAHDKDFPIRTSEDDHLPRGHNIKVVARLVRKELKRVKDPVFSTGLNLKSGTFDVVQTRSGIVADCYRKAQQNVKDEFERDPNQAAAAKDNECALPPKEHSPSTLSRKRKAVSREIGSVGSSNSPSKVMKQEKPQPKPQQPSDKWRSELEVLLQKNRENAKQRRANKEALGVEEKALETAIAVWSTNAGDNSSTLDALVQQADVGTSEERRQFLTGNRKKFLSNRVLCKLTPKWEAWLQDEQSKEA